MTIRKIARLGHPVLRKKTREVTREEISSPDMTNLFDWFQGNSALTFARPWLLLLLLAIPLLAWLRGKSGPAAALTYSSTTSLRAIGKQSAARAGKILRALLLLALAFFVVALARPQLGKSLTQIEASGIHQLPKSFSIGGRNHNVRSAHSRAPAR